MQKNNKIIHNIFKLSDYLIRSKKKSKIYIKWYHTKRGKSFQFGSCKRWKKIVDWHFECCNKKTRSSSTTSTPPSPKKIYRRYFLHFRSHSSLFKLIAQFITIASIFQIFPAYLLLIYSLYLKKKKRWISLIIIIIKIKQQQIFYN